MEGKRKIISCALPITSSEGQGYLVMIAEGAITQRRKPIVASGLIFPNEEEKARLAAGETISQIIAGYGDKSADLIMRIAGPLSSTYIRGHKSTD